MIDFSLVPIMKRETAFGEGTYHREGFMVYLNAHQSSNANVRDGGILQERLERSQAEDFVQHFAADSLFFRAAERDVRRTNQVVDYGLHLRSRADVLQRGESL